MPLTSVDTVAYDNIIARQGVVKTLKQTSGAGAKEVGDILKRVLTPAIAADTGNTGNGTAGTITIGTDARIGSYLLQCASRAGVITAGTVTKGAGNTGDGVAGTATPGTAVKEGTYTLNCIALAGTVSAGTVTPGVSNVGNGAPGTCTPGTAVVPGTYTMLCTAGITGLDHIAIEDLAADADIAAREEWVAPSAGEFVEIGILSKGTPAGIDDSNTCVIAVKDSAGNTVVTKTYNTGTAFPTTDYESLGTLDATHKLFTADEHFTIEVTNGTAANTPAFDVVLLYKAAGDTADAGTFAVFDPNGARLQDLTVGIAYLNNHFGLTIADGTADFAPGDTFTVAMTLNASAATFDCYDPDGFRLADLTVGVAYDNGHFSLTIADGATDFVVGDTFTIAMALNASAAVFNVYDTMGRRLADLTVGVAYDNDHWSVTIADGATDFAVGDLFTVTVTDSGEVTEADGYNNVLAGILLEDSDSTSAATYPAVMISGGAVVQASLNAPAGLTVAGFKVALKEQLGIEMDASVTY